MLSIIQDIPDFVLSSQLDIVIGADKQVTFSLNKGGSVILQETYTPDSKNQVHILDLFSLMEPYLLTTPLSQFSYTCSASGETSISKTFTVLLSQYLIPVTATYFVKNYFLTALAGRDKITAMNRKETLYITMGVVDASFIVPVSAECIYSDDNNNINKVTRNIGFSFRGDISSIDVSPSLFAKDGYKLLRYTITAGARRQVYRLDHDAPDSIGIKFGTHSDVWRHSISEVLKKWSLNLLAVQLGSTARTEPIISTSNENILFLPDIFRKLCSHW